MTFDEAKQAMHKGHTVQCRMKYRIVNAVMEVENGWWATMPSNMTFWPDEINSDKWTIVKVAGGEKV